jgi:hypothetical protein
MKSLIDEPVRHRFEKDFIPEVASHAGTILSGKGQAVNEPLL